jgi:hypothetical protein
MKKVISIDGTTIAFEQSGTGPAVILVDGAMAYRELFGGRPLAAELSKEFTVITYDRRAAVRAGYQPYAVERDIKTSMPLSMKLVVQIFIWLFIRRRVGPGER